MSSTAAALKTRVGYRRYRLPGAGLSAKPGGSPEQQEQEALLRHLPQVYIIAKKIRGRFRCNVELEDLIGYGTVGLIKAMRSFDHSRGILLKTYAQYRIRGAILDGLRGMNWLSRSACRNKVRYQQSLRAEREGFPRGSATDEIPLLEIICAGSDLEDLEQISQKTGWRQAVRAGEDPAVVYEDHELARRMARAVSRLPLRQRQVIELYYQRELSMKEIGAILHVHQSRVSQLHTVAIRKLRGFLADAC